MSSISNQTSQYSIAVAPRTTHPHKQGSDLRCVLWREMCLEPFSLQQRIEVFENRKAIALVQPVCSDIGGEPRKMSPIQGTSAPLF